jgi:electron transfer flavoprotein alpha subunit
MSEANGILIVGELVNARLSSVTSELLNAGGQLAGNLGQPLYAVLLGTNLQNAAQEAICNGASKVFLAEHPLLNEEHVEAHVSALHQVAEQVQPGILLIGRTQLGRELGPRLAFRLRVGLAQDAWPCCRARYSAAPGYPPVYGGNAMAVVTMSGKPQIVTVRPKV